MNINTVADNLRNTIRGKEAYLVKMQTKAIKAEDNANMAAAFATIEFLKINIEELKVILFDVEKACEQWNLMSWEINPERMGQ
jgi:hypothetical protein